jgi:hypothetical protein
VYNVAELPHQQSPKPQWTLKSNCQKSTKRTLITLIKSSSLFD